MPQNPPQSPPATVGHESAQQGSAELPLVHPSAILSPETTLEPGVSIGPFCTTTGPVHLASGVRLIANVHLQGPISIGANTTLYPGASLGFEPQDYKFTPGMPTAGVRIGSRCLIRECVTIHAATNTTTPTIIGDDCYLMACSHAGHDCVLGNKVILVNYVGLSGHITVEDNVTLSGHVGVHQFVRIGRLAFLSGGVAIGQDIPPFCTVNERQRIGGINVVGMRRAGMDRNEITRVKEAYRKYLRNPCTRDEMIEGLNELGKNSPAVQEMAAFVKASKRGICAGLGKPPRSLSTWLHRLRKGEVTLASASDEATDQP